MVINHKQEKKRPLLITCLSANRIFYEVSVTKTHGPSAERHHFLVQFKQKPFSQTSSRGEAIPCLIFTQKAENGYNLFTEPLNLFRDCCAPV